MFVAPSSYRVRDYTPVNSKSRPPLENHILNKHFMVQSAGGPQRVRQDDASIMHDSETRRVQEEYKMAAP